VASTDGELHKLQSQLHPYPQQQQPGIDFIIHSHTGTLTRTNSFCKDSTPTVRQAKQLPQVPSQRSLPVQQPQQQPQQQQVQQQAQILRRGNTILEQVAGVELVIVKFDYDAEEAGEVNSFFFFGRFGRVCCAAQ
jgi:hypothetical protein